MHSKWARIGWTVLLLSVMGGSAVMASSVFGTTFDLGEEIRFRIEDSTTWWWGCCSCEESLVLAWWIVGGSEQVVYSVIHDAPVSAAIWQGSWLQIGSDEMAIAPGRYKLYVDTSAGTLSRCFTVRDPCACTWCPSACTSCVCEDVAVITNCACSTRLVFVEDDCETACFPFFLWGCCSSCP